MALGGLGMGAGERNNRTALLGKTFGRLVTFHFAGKTGAAAGCTGLARLILRSRGIRRDGGNASSDRVRMGSRSIKVRVGPALGMDGVRVSAVSRFHETA